MRIIVSVLSLVFMTTGVNAVPSDMTGKTQAQRIEAKKERLAAERAMMKQRHRSAVGKNPLKGVETKLGKSVEDEVNEFHKQLEVEDRAAMKSESPFKGMDTKLGKEPTPLTADNGLTLKERLAARKKQLGPEQVDAMKKKAQ